MVLEEQNKQKEGVQSLSKPFHKFSQRRKEMTRREKRNFNFLVVFCIVAVSLIGVSIWRISYGIYQVNLLNKQEQKLQKKQTNLDKKISNLNRDVKMLNDDEYVQKVARERYMVTKNGEVIFVISDKNKNNKNDNADNDKNQEVDQEQQTN